MSWTWTRLPIHSYFTQKCTGSKNGSCTNYILASITNSMSAMLTATYHNEWWAIASAPHFKTVGLRKMNSQPSQNMGFYAKQKKAWMEESIMSVWIEKCCSNCKFSCKSCTIKHKWMTICAVQAMVAAGSNLLFLFFCKHWLWPVLQMEDGCARRVRDTHIQKARPSRHLQPLSCLHRMKYSIPVSVLQVYDPWSCHKCYVDISSL